MSSGCMWGLSAFLFTTSAARSLSWVISADTRPDRHTRPGWTTGSLIPLSFLCGIGYVPSLSLFPSPSLSSQTPSLNDEGNRRAHGTSEQVS